MTRFAFAILLFVNPIAGAEVFVWTPSNDQYVVDVTKSELVKHVKMEIAPAVHMQTDRMVMIHEGRVLSDYESIALYGGKEVFVMTNQSSSDYRNYNQPIAPKDQETIRFIFSTLGKPGMVALLSLKSKEKPLKEAGKTIQHIHPLKILEFTLNDEELKISMVVIRDRSLVWKPFAKDMSASLQKEHERGNLTAHHLQQFADALSIELALIKPHFDKRQWANFIRTAISSVPRQGNASRYNM